MPFTVAIIGRPNVGKSTLFNRLVGRRLALVDNRPGVTRDWREGEGRIGPLHFRVIDTAGLEDADPATLEGRMRRQTEAALAESDMALMMIDARAGVTPIDEHFVRWLRRLPIRTVLVANKCEGRAGLSGSLEAFSLGLGDPLQISAEHGEGMADLHDAVADVIASHAAETVEEAGEGAEDGPLRIAILGQPNAGKSTLANRLIGEERLLTGPEPGITRDSIGVAWEWKGRPVLVYDTAGLRRRARVVDRVEKLAVGDAERAMDFAHVVVLLLDATDPMARQDLTIARRAIDEGRGLVVVLNKWDLVTEKRETLRDLEDRLLHSLAQLRGVPVVTLSGLTGAGLNRLMPAVVDIYERWQTRVTTAQLNRWLAAMTDRHPPPLGPQGRRIRLRYATQAKARPPTFIIFTNTPEALPDSYSRYLQNGLRETFALEGVPIRIHLRKGKNPYAQ